VFPDESWRDRTLRYVQPDGRILIASWALKTWNGVPVGSLIRVEANGTLDTSFQVTLQPPGSQVSALTLDDQGRLWISGTFTNVNDIARPGLARLFAYDPVSSPPQIEATVTRSRIATGETLNLTAHVSGSPSATFQWYRDDLPIPEASFRGLRFPVADGTLPAEFKLEAWNSLGTNVLSFGRIEAAIRSPRPGLVAPEFGVRLTNVYPITHLLPLADGRILFGAGFGLGDQQPRTLVGRLTAEGTLDPVFGSGGLVNGTGRVEDLVARPDGSVLVVGSFTSLAGELASGIAELSSTGQRVERNFPELDSPSITTLLPLPNGQWILAGRFTRVSGVPKFRLARLQSDFSLDPGFDASATFEPWQVVDVLALDREGRLLAGGSGLAFEGTLTNPPLYGMVRLLDDGTQDPEFTRVSAPVRSIFVESEGTLVTGIPLRRWNSEGHLVTSFNGNPALPEFAIEPDRRLLRLPDGTFVAAIPGTGPAHRIRRWQPDGQIDELFETPFNDPRSFDRVTAAAALPDGSVLLAVMDGRGGSLIRRIPPDSDSRLADPRLEGGNLKADLYTQPGREYRILSRNSVGDAPVPVGDPVPGDGYLSTVGVPETGSQGYIEARRPPAP
ncbi:MAG: hypothetical protein KIT22_11475, partial [Verrucomicrobiae bacterium]|nr:hypothetical protein [Verrucomicrobiae bacterium]